MPFYAFCCAHRCLMEASIRIRSFTTRHPWPTLRNKTSGNENVNSGNGEQTRYQRLIRNPFPTKHVSHHMAVSWPNRLWMGTSTCFGQPQKASQNQGCGSQRNHKSYITYIPETVTMSRIRTGSVASHFDLSNPTKWTNISTITYTLLGSQDSLITCLQISSAK